MAQALTPRTAHVTRVFRAATPEQITAGAEWYAEANRTALVFAERYGVSVDVAAGVIAALSPLNSWAANKSLAERFLAAGGLDAGYMTVGLNKGKRILEGEDIATVLHSPKVTNFYRCIATNGDTDAVCIDRHAHDIAVNKRMSDATRPKLAGKRYDAFADTYRAAGRIVGVSPAKVQAITWTVWRQRYWSVGAFDGQSVA